MPDLHSMSPRLIYWTISCYIVSLNVNPLTAAVVRPIAPFGKASQLRRLPSTCLRWNAKSRRMISDWNIPLPDYAKWVRLMVFGTISILPWLRERHTWSCSPVSHRRWEHRLHMQSGYQCPCKMLPKFSRSHLEPPWQSRCTSYWVKSPTGREWM